MEVWSLKFEWEEFCKNFNDMFIIIAYQAPAFDPVLISIFGAWKLVQICTCTVISQTLREEINCFKKHLGNKFAITGVEYIFTFSLGRIFQRIQALGQVASFNVYFVTKSFSTVSCVIIIWAAFALLFGL